MKKLILAVLAFATASISYAEPVASVASPDGAITVDITLDNDGRALYEIKRSGAQIIAPSRMGFLFTDAEAFSRNLKLETATRSSVDETWEQPWGERRYVRDQHNELKIRLREKTALARAFDVTFRVFNDGVGFRYSFPDQEKLRNVNIQNELTEFAVAQPGTAWWITGGDWNRYEYLYQKTPIESVGTAHTPITMKLQDGTYVSFHEAVLVDFAAMWLRKSQGQTFLATLSNSGSGPRVARKAPFDTPWRTLRIAPSAAKLAESDLELNLNEPNKLGDVSWFKPHKYVGIWWEMHLGKSSWSSGSIHGATTANALRHIDFAAKHGFRGVLIEGWNKGWDGDWFGHGDDFSFTQPYPDFDLEKVAGYARKKGVHLIGHHETGGNIANYEDQLEDALKLYARLGVDAVKTGYVADAGGIRARGPDGKLMMEWHDGQVQSRHHLKVVETAAKYKIAINPHEPIKDTGLRRTYPNWVSREGARGMEYNAWGNPNNPTTHEPTLVFTRMLSGPMDFTPGVLSLQGRDGNMLSSTLARQLGLYVVIYSPIQMAADLIDNLEKYPREFRFIGRVPADWSESKMLSGEIGEHVVFARKDRASANWYVGGVTDDTKRKVSLNFDFLDAGKTYKATLYRDGDNADYRTASRHDIVIERKLLRKGDKLDVTMAPGGGFAIEVVRQ